MAQGFADVRKEMAQGFADVRKEMAQGFEKVNARIDEKTDAFAKGLAELGEKVVGHGKEMASMRSTVKATFVIVSVATSVVTIAGVVVGIGKALDWF